MRAGLSDGPAREPARACVCPRAYLPARECECECGVEALTYPR